MLQKLRKENISRMGYLLIIRYIIEELRKLNLQKKLDWDLTSSLMTFRCAISLVEKDRELTDKG